MSVQVDVTRQSSRSHLVKIVGQLAPKGYTMPDVLHEGDFEIRIRIKGDKILARLPDQSSTEG